VTLSLVRVDDRLVHGQVVVGWVQALGAKRILVVDDDLADNVWERELYALGVPPGLAVDFTPVSTAPALIADAIRAAERTIVLVANVESAVRLCAATHDVKRLNIGGLHNGDGRTKRLPYVYMTADEAAQLRALRETGIEVAAQDVPTARPVPLEELL
jgi:PTS system mannose-specific IIB component/fructoselysine and glucoselysine-specific PTS system IIB component